MSKSKVLFILSGSIACYKACQVISKLVQAGCDVQTVASPSALQFIGNATLEGLTGKPVISDLFKAGNVMDHIHLVRWADLIVTAPATASFVNKAAQGVGDDLIQTLFLAHDFSKPFLIAPAMNVAMYNHPITQNSLAKLKEMGLEIIDSAAGMLACGEEGKGRLAEPEVILSAIQKHLSSKGLILDNTQTPSSAVSSATKARKILITAGGTQETIDDVRVITNTSTGQTGVKIAEYFEHLGFAVTLVKAKNAVTSVVQNQKLFTDFKSLEQILKSELSQSNYDCVIHAAAVSDYSVSSLSFGDTQVLVNKVNKLSSDFESMNIHLQKNPKLVNHLKEYSLNKKMKLVAFKLTSKASTEEQSKAVEKLIKASSADFIVHNDLANIDKSQGHHRFSIFTNPLILGANNNQKALPPQETLLKSIHCENTEELCQELSRLVYDKEIL